LVASYEFWERLASRINDHDPHKRNVRAILYRAVVVLDTPDSDAISCMTLAYNEITKAVNSTGTELPESIAVAGLS
jgi:hypothetical protein